MIEIFKILGIFIILNAIIYLLGSFIAFDWNCLDWSLMKSGLGRSCVILIEVVTLNISIHIND
jgi:hypothetical protein